MIEVPAFAIGVWLLARLGIGDQSASFMRILRLTTVFASTAALFTAAGIGRLAAYASVDKIGGRRHAVLVAGRTHAVAGVGLILIAVIPLGHLPDRVLPWLAILVVGALIGAWCGAVIAAVCGSAGPMRIGDVMAVAIKRPGEALRSLLDPEELLKIGAAVRQRFGTIFDQRSEHEPKPPDERTDGTPKPSGEPRE